MRADQSSVFGGMVIPSGFTCTITHEPVDPEAWYTVTATDYELNMARHSKGIEKCPGDGKSVSPGHFLKAYYTHAVSYTHLTLPTTSRV